MTRYQFKKIDVGLGSVCIQVCYRLDTNGLVSSAPKNVPTIIEDYQPSLQLSSPTLLPSTLPDMVNRFGSPPFRGESFVKWSPSPGSGSLPNLSGFHGGNFAPGHPRGRPEGSPTPHLEDLFIGTTLRKPKSSNATTNSFAGSTIYQNSPRLSTSRSEASGNSKPLLLSVSPFKEDSVLSSSLPKRVGTTLHSRSGSQTALENSFLVSDTAAWKTSSSIGQSSGNSDPDELDELVQMCLSASLLSQSAASRLSTASYQSSEQQSEYLDDLIDSLESFADRITNL